MTGTARSSRTVVGLAADGARQVDAAPGFAERHRGPATAVDQEAVEEEAAVDAVDVRRQGVRRLRLATARTA